MSDIQSVTAKFKVNRLSEYDTATEVELTPDYAEGKNKEWAEFTPAGMMRMTVKNSVAAEFFKQNRSFTVTFTPDE